MAVIVILLDVGRVLTHNCRTSSRSLLQWLFGLGSDLFISFWDLYKECFHIFHLISVSTTNSYNSIHSFTRIWSADNFIMVSTISTSRETTALVSREGNFVHPGSSSHIEFSDKFALLKVKSYPGVFSSMSSLVFTRRNLFSVCSNIYDLNSIDILTFS